jgi:hypothetical protein
LLAGLARPALEQAGLVIEPDGLPLRHFGNGVNLTFLVVLSLHTGQAA